MLLTHNDGRLARQVDKPRFAGPHVCSPESSHERDDATRFVGMGSRTRTQRCPGQRAIGEWVEIKLTERPTLIRAPKRLSVGGTATKRSCGSMKTNEQDCARQG